MTDTSTVTVPPPPPPPPPPAEPWYHGATDEEVGYLQNRGWDKLPPKDVALAAAKAHREAEKLIGAPADKVVRLPKDANDVEGWNNFRAKTGVPADEKGYDLTAIKHADGTALDEGFTSAIAKALLAAGVAKDKAPDIVKGVVSIRDAETAAAKVASDAALAAQRDTLKINWGSNAEANRIIAKNAAAALGVKPEAVAALEGQIGYAEVMEMFRNIGTKIGEDTFVTTQTPGGRQIMSVDQAKATLESHQNDSAWRDKLLNGDSTATAEFHNLTTIISKSGR